MAWAFTQVLRQNRPVVFSLWVALATTIPRSRQCSKKLSWTAPETLIDSALQPNRTEYQSCDNEDNNENNNIEDKVFVFVKEDTKDNDDHDNN